LSEPTFEDAFVLPDELLLEVVLMVFLEVCVSMLFLTLSGVLASLMVSPESSNGLEAPDVRWVAEV